MDNFHSMFPFQQDDDANYDSHQQLLFPHEPYTNPSNFIYQQDLVTDFAPFELGDNNLTFNNNNNNNNNNQRGNRLGKSSVTSTSDDNKQKKVMHREIERQRRQEMSTLYASLRQQLPLENIKGKRSTSDHILEAANYIEQLQKNVKNLEERREKLKKESIGLSNPQSGSSIISYSSPAIVIVKECLDGMEILVNCDLKNEGFRLSRVLQVLLQEGLSIVNCSCTKTNTTSLLHTIRTEVCTDQPRIINVDVIQQKLQDIIHADTSFK
ncbi:transcription factor bHLH36-like [Solanum dulcamara]|uniref:transcription factor bHLH36-like n=1 Tax=Solanum dulcamara TaxID=45834 RepID=UPI0024862915|nr:transcription factor bHLH36-like [Solanum dulcamara]